MPMPRLLEAAMKIYALSAFVLFFASTALSQIVDVQNIAKWNCNGSGSSVTCPAGGPPKQI
jgi:hypothetical protein